jgi:hypothetical protein
MISPNGKEFFVVADRENRAPGCKRFSFWELFCQSFPISECTLSALNDYVIALADGIVKTITLPQEKGTIELENFEVNQKFDSNLDTYLILDDDRFIIFDSQSERNHFHIIDVKRKQNLVYKTYFTYDAICRVQNSKIKIRNYQTDEFYLLDFSNRSV